MRPCLALLLLFSIPVFADGSSPPTPPRQPESKEVKPYLLASLRRTACYGRCPSYLLEVFSDGVVKWYGERWVKVTGTAVTQLSPAQLDALRAAFAHAKYFDLGGGYDCHDVTDNPWAITSFSDGTRTKELKHYYGCRSKKGVEVLTRLERRIDDIVGTARWVGPEKERMKQ